MAASDYQNLVQSLYVAYFGRPADPLGLINFESALAAANAPTTLDGLNAAYSTNTAIKSLVDSFGASAEFTAGNTSNTMSSLNQIYQNLFGRTPDFSGLLFWVNCVETGTLTIGRAALAIAAGATANTIQGSLDVETLAHKVTVASNFTASLDTAEKLNAYSGLEAASFARSLLSGVTSTTDTAAFQPTVLSTVADITAISIESHKLTQTVTDLNSNPSQQIDLGTNPQIFVEVKVPNGLPGFSPAQLTYSVDKNGLLTFQGTLASVLTAAQKAVIIEQDILKNDTTHIIFFNDGKNGYAIRNDGTSSSSDHFVQFTDHTITGGNGGGTQSGTDGLIKFVGINYDAPIIDINDPGWSSPCDIRLKKNISFVRTTELGVKLYEFAYHGDEQRFIGPMAQDLIADERFAHSVRKNESGFYQVDFTAIGIEHLASKEMIDAGINAVQTRRK